MINIIVEPALLIGVIFAVAMVFFYLLRFIHPDLSTDWDIFIATLGLVYSAIIIIHGWRLDPILLFSQVLLVFITFSFGWTLIRQREIIRVLMENSEEDESDQDVNKEDDSEPTEIEKFRDQLNGEEEENEYEEDDVDEDDSEPTESEKFWDQLNGQEEKEQENKDNEKIDLNRVIFSILAYFLFLILLNCFLLINK